MLHLNLDVKCEIPQTLLIKAITRINTVKQACAWAEVNHKDAAGSGPAPKEREHEWRPTCLAVLGERSPTYLNGFEALLHCPVPSSYLFICKVFSVWKTEQD